jgi:hypothetical protein
MEGQKLKVFEKGALRIILRLKKDEIIGCSRRCHNEELHKFYPSSNKLQ